MGLVIAGYVNSYSEALLIPIVYPVAVASHCSLAHKSRPTKTRAVALVSKPIIGGKAVKSKIL
jgi:hypothetical protein